MSKSKKHLRSCPALGRDITSAECGEGRGSAYACPVDCPYFPFTPANYDQHGEIESRLIGKTYERAARTLPAAERDRMLDEMEAQRGDEVLAHHSRHAWRFHWQRDAEGRTFGERWLEEKTSGLSNDERVLLAGMNRMRPVLLEVQRILDEQTVEGVDLLDGRAMRVVDRSCAATVSRFSVLLLWCYPMPHYERTSGGGMYLSDVDRVEPLGVLREVVRHLGGPSDPAGEQRWLAQHFARTCEALSAVQSARWQDALAAIDARFSRTDYRVLKGARLDTLLGRNPDVSRESVSEDEAQQGFAEGYVWFDRPRSEASDQIALPLPQRPKVAMGEAVLGRVLLGRERVRIEAMSSERHRDLRARFERLAAGGVEFLGEREEDLGAQTLGRRPADFDAALVPPRLLENPKRIHLASQRVGPVGGSAEQTLLAAVQHQYAAFPDEPIPWLDDRTPRAAAADPALRPRLVSLMKTHIRDIDRRRRGEGLDFDLNPLLEQLGLHELISPPPPLGVAEREDEALDLPEWDDDGDPDDFAILPPLEESLGSPSPIDALSEREFDRRLKAMQRKYPEPDMAVEATEAEYPGLLNLAWDVTRPALEDRAFPFLEILIVRACHVLRSRTGPVQRLNFGRIERATIVEFAQAGALAAAGAKFSATGFERWLMDTPQPVVIQDLAGVLETITGKQRRKERASHGDVLMMLAFLKALVAELSRAIA